MQRAVALTSRRRYLATAASRGRVLLPLSGSSRTREGIWIYTSSGGLPLLANRLSGALSQLHHLAVPGHSRHWKPPIDSEQLQHWLTQVETVTRSPVAEWAVQLPSDSRRRRFGLLLMDVTRRAVAYAKFVFGAKWTTALAMQQALTDRPPSLSWTPSLILAGELDGWGYTVSSVMPQGPHAPAALDRHQRAAVVADFQRRILEGVQPHSGLVPIHGDFGPWNVRRLDDGRIAIIDWEEAGWGPSGVDEIWHSVHSNLSTFGRLEHALAAVRREFEDWDPLVLVDAAKYWLDWHRRDEPAEVMPGQSLSGRQAKHVGKVLAILTMISNDTG